MHKFFVLLRVSLRSMLHTLAFGHSKKRASSGAAALLLLGGLALYLSGIYSFLMADALDALGLLEFLLPIMALMSCMIALLLTTFGASGIVFGNKDSDLLLSMPVTSFSIMLSKIVALYLENLLFCGLWLIPSCLAYFLKTSGSVLGFVLRALICIPFFAFLPTLLGVLIGYCMVLFSAHAKHKALISNCLSCVFFVVILAGSLQVNRLPSLLLTNTNLLRRLLQTWLLPFGLLHRSIAAGDPFSFLLFCALCTLPFWMIVSLLSNNYKQILSSLSSHALRTDFKLARMGARGPLLALLRKELCRYFGTPIYCFNTGFGGILWLGGAVYLCFARSSVLKALEMLQLAQFTPALVCAALMLCIGTVCTTCVSISLEGNALWILKEAPISIRQLFLAKLGTNFIIAWPAAAIGLALVSWALALPLAAALCIFLLCTVFIAHTAMFGLIINLLLPKMDADNDTLVVKQSASSLCGVFGAMLTSALCIGAYFLFDAALGLLLFLLLTTSVLCIVCALEWYWLMHSGAKTLARL